MAPENSVAASAKKRRRPAVACERCRQRKIKCDTQSPCNNCTKARNHTCTYVSTHIPKSRALKLRQATASEAQSGPRPLAPAVGKSITSSADYMTPSFEPFSGSSSSPSNTHTSIATPATTASHTNWPRVGANKLEVKQSQDHALGFRSTGCILVSQDAATPPIRGSISKTRYFGQSHWMNGASMFPKELGTLVAEEADQGKLFQALHKCKLLGRKIKAHRLQPILSTQLGENMPSRQDADALVENYINTFEGIFRIIHIPIFRADYERYWQDVNSATDALVLLIKLCMALGSTVRDDSDAWKPTAMQWVREAHVWLTLPPEKSRLTLQGIQIMCLILLCKSVIGLGQDLTWVLTGGVIRNAMYMGLHRDPKHLAKMTTYAAEMRRRLWATIMELNLQFATEAGGLPLISELDYDTELPANLDDEQLDDEPDKTKTPPPSESALTQSTIFIALAKSLPFRLRLINDVNNFRSVESYDRTLEINTTLSEICQGFSTKMNALIGKKPSPAAKAPINSCHVLFGEMLLYRFFHTLHMPVVTKAFDDPKYYFSRQICVSSSLKLSSMWGFSDPKSPNEVLDPGVASFRRLVISGTGVFRNIPALSLFILSRELLEQRGTPASGLGLFPAATNQDLRAHLECFKAWSLERIRAGETSVKEHCFISALLAHTDALAQGLDAKAITKFMIDKCTESVTLTLGILTEHAEKAGIMGENANIEGVVDYNDDMTAFSMDWNSGLDWENGSLWKSGWWQMNIMPNLDEFDPGVFP